MRMRERLAYQAVWDRVASILLTLTLAFTLACAGALLIAPRAQAGGDTATLQITSSPPFVYYSSISVQMTVTLATQLSSSALAQQSQTLRLSNGVTLSLGWVSTSGLTLTYSGRIDTSANGGLAPPGDYTATASYFNPDTKVTTSSNPVSFTVDKAPSTTSCQIQQGMVVAGQTFYISTNLTDNASGDTYVVQLSGPENISATLQTDANQNLHMTAPTLPGTYTVTCNFEGNRLYNPSSATTTMSVHDNAYAAGMKLYTNPTTVTRGVPMTFYIVLEPKPGYPAPTGYLAITMGIFAYRSIPVGANGATLVQLSPLPVQTTNPFSQITISYGGDSRYLNSSSNFPLTNPAIPGSAPHSGATTSGASGKSGKSGASATPTATAGRPTPTPTATATLAAAPTPATPVSATRPGSVRSPINTLSPWLAGGSGALVVLGALGSGLALAQRRKRAPANAAQEPITAADATQGGARPDPDQ